MQTTILSIKGLEKDRSLGSAEAYRLRVPALEVRRTEKVLLTGPSGSGKSTLLDMLGMVLKPDRAEQFLFYPEAGKSAAPFDAAGAWRAQRTESLALMRRRIGYVLQTGGLLPFLSVRENIRAQRRLLGLKADDSLTASLVEELRISHLLGKLPATLSVGERQRVAIARALAADPSLVLADEPTAALDPQNAATVLAMFSRAVEELGATLVLVTHAPEQVKAMRFTRYQVRTGRDERGEALAVLQAEGAALKTESDTALHAEQPSGPAQAAP